MKKIALAITLLVSGLSLSAQIQLRFVPTFRGLPLELEQVYVTEKGDSVRIETLRFYISQIALQANGQTNWAEKNSFHLVDLGVPSTLHIPLTGLENISFDRLHFSVGIDSNTNVSGAMGGDLDPTLGMYWAWQSGYINFKLEGQSPTCPSRKNRFQYHVGGYQGAFAALQRLDIPVAPADEIQIAVAIDDLLAQLDLATEFQIMEPGAAAVEFADRFPQVFQWRAP